MCVWGGEGCVCGLCVHESCTSATQSSNQRRRIMFSHNFFHERSKKVFIKYPNVLCQHFIYRHTTIIDAKYISPYVETKPGCFIRILQML